MESKFENFYKNKRILITGADGFVGSHLTERLLNYDALISVYIHNKKLKNLNHIKDKLKNIIIGDIKDKETIKVIIKNDPQIIFHLAADEQVTNSIKNPLKTIKTNLFGTGNILEATRLITGLERLVFTSSCVVYGTSPHPIKEINPFNPNNPYAVSKAASDSLCYSYYKTYNLPISIIRPFNIYGPKKNSGVISSFIRLALTNDNIKLDGGGLQTRDFTYIDDIISAFLIMGSNKKAIGEPINFGSGEDISIRELTGKIIKYCDSKSSIINVEERLGQDIKSCCDNSKARELFNWKPKVGLDEGLKRTIRWVKSIA